MKRKFEMYQYRQVLVRMRQGDSDRDIDRSKIMGRKKLAAVRKILPALGPPRVTGHEMTGLMDRTRVDLSKALSRGTMRRTIPRSCFPQAMLDGIRCAPVQHLADMGTVEP